MATARSFQAGVQGRARPSLRLECAVLFLLPLAALTTGCRFIACHDCDPLRKSYRYVNETSVPVVFSVRDPRLVTIDPGGTLSAGDTLTVVVKAPAPDGDLFPWDASPRFEMRFEARPPRCLVYEGPVRDTLNDPRSERAYAGPQGVDGVYRITAERAAAATECP